MRPLKNATQQRLITTHRARKAGAPGVVSPPRIGSSIIRDGILTVRLLIWKVSDRQKLF